MNYGALCSNLKQLEGPRVYSVTLTEALKNLLRTKL